MQKCQDCYCTTFGSYSEMLNYHQEQEQNSQWIRCKVSDLSVEQVDKSSAKEGLLRSSITLNLKYLPLGAADPVETDVRLRFRSTRKAKEKMYVMSV